MLIISFASKLILELLETVDLNINNLSSYSPTEYFKTKIYVSLILSLVFTAPLWLISIYNFSAPGLTEKEKINVKFSLGIGLLFSVGTCSVTF